MAKRNRFGLGVVFSCFALAASAVSCGGDGRESQAENAVDSPLAPNAQVLYARVDLRGLDPTARDSIKEHPGVKRWVELDRQLLVLANRTAVDDLSARYEVTPLDVSPHPDRLCLSRGARHGGAVKDGALLAWSSDLVVLQTASRADCADDAESLRLAAAKTRPIDGNEVVVRQLLNTTSSTSVSEAPHTASVVGALDMDRWEDNVSTLSSFDRYALRPVKIAEAEEWIAGELCNIADATLGPSLPAGGVRCENGKRRVETAAFTLGAGVGRNVMLTMEGFVQDGPVFVIGAHYDAIATEAGATRAPGAEDNASGTAALVEMATALARYPSDATFVFVAFSGEEQGLVGSTSYVQQLANTAFAERIQGVFIMDMIGYSGDTELDCILETTNTPQNLALLDHMADMASLYAPELVLSTTTNPFGSDHVPFLDAGYRALLAIENDYDTYPFYHSKNDTLANQNSRFQPMASLIVRMNTAAVAEWSQPNAFYAALGVIL